MSATSSDGMLMQLPQEILIKTLKAATHRSSQELENFGESLPLNTASYS